MTHARFFIESLLPTNWWGLDRWQTVAAVCHGGAMCAESPEDVADLAMLRDIAFYHAESEQ